jgi:FixJ family two-component response regulator
MTPQSIAFVVDDDPSVRKSLGRLLTSAGITTELFSSGAEYMNRAKHNGPGCLILDVRLPELDGLTLQQMLKSSGDRVPIIFITGHGDIPMSVHAMKEGAFDFLTKPVDDSKLLKTVESALERSRQVLEQLSEVEEILRRYETLTPREREVMEGVVAGKLNKQIAADLGTVEKTIKVHRGRVMEKMDVESVAELVMAAERIRGARGLPEENFTHV